MIVIIWTMTKNVYENISAGHFIARLNFLGNCRILSWSPDNSPSGHFFENKLSTEFYMRLIIFLTAVIISPLISSKTIEENRIAKATQAMPQVFMVHAKLLNRFTQDWSKLVGFKSAYQFIEESGESLWKNAKKNISNSKSYDDRPLYWARLQMSLVIREHPLKFKFSKSQRKQLLDLLEKTSRGTTDLDFNSGVNKKILLTGFDPFLLDRNIDQSNPSGVIALLLDGKIIELNGVKAEINTVMIPVKFDDFDQGLIESILSPYYAENSVNMVVTVSMGRKEFDLERFPGLRRSASVPGNQNILTGGSKQSPVLPLLNGQALTGDEFVEFSLPVKAMLKADGEFEINDNHQVTTLEKTFKAKSLKELKGKTSVQGSGGGYLSNEISYRSIRTRNLFESKIPTGHIHTPRIKSFEPETIKKIVKQIEIMLKLSLSEI